MSCPMRGSRRNFLSKSHQKTPSIRFYLHLSLAPNCAVDDRFVGSAVTCHRRLHDELHRELSFFSLPLLVVMSGVESEAKTEKIFIPNHAPSQFAHKVAFAAFFPALHFGNIVFI